MAIEPIIGIDLGTTNSEVAFVLDGRPRVLELADNGMVPSCVGLDADGRILVGKAARNQAVAMPERTVVSIKRKMGSGERVRLGEETFTPQEISAFILRDLKERAESVLKRSVSRAVITVPAYFTDAQRQATRDAGTIAGLEVVRIINEPTAAAMAYREEGTEPRTVLVYDLGGGTFDVSVVRIEAGVVEVLASTGDTHLGGDDFDRLILDRLVRHMEEELGVSVPEDDLALRARLLRAAEAVKITLSTSPVARIEEDHVGDVDGRPRHLSYELTRSEFVEMIEPAIDRTMASVSKALGDASVRPTDLDRVLLVGGSTRIPRIAQRLAERLEQEPHGEVDPDLCVALGASIQAGVEMGLDVERVLVDITPYTFGTSVLGEVNGRPSMTQFIPIIRRNTRLPAERSDLFYKMHAAQDVIEVDVYQGEDPDALNNVRIGLFRFGDLSDSDRDHERGILITYRLDLNGILHVHAVERGTGKEIRGVVQDALNGASDEHIQKARRRVATLAGTESLYDSGPSPSPNAVSAGDGSSDVPEDVKDVLNRAGGILDSATDEDRKEIGDLLERIRALLGDGRNEEAGECVRELEEILFYLEG